VEVLDGCKLFVKALERVASGYGLDFAGSLAFAVFVYFEKACRLVLNVREESRNLVVTTEAIANLRR